MKRIDIINGANLNMIGYREKDTYGNTSLEKINEKCIEQGKKHNIEVKTYHSNIEGELINYIHSLYNKSNGIIINAGAYTHYSIAIRDALLSISIPFIEIHISNIFKREKIRHKSILSDKASGIICGFGEYTYYLAIEAIKNII